MLLWHRHGPAPPSLLCCRLLLSPPGYSTNLANSWLLSSTNCPLLSSCLHPTYRHCAWSRSFHRRRCSSPRNFWTPCSSTARRWWCRHECSSRIHWGGRSFLPPPPSLDNPQTFSIDEEHYYALSELPLTYPWPSITIDLRDYVPFLERHLIAL